jgi:biotin operon repressor
MIRRFSGAAGLAKPPPLATQWRPVGAGTQMAHDEAERSETMPAPRLRIDQDCLHANRRLAVYAIVNATIALNSEMGRAWDMRPAELQIFMMIGLASIQRYVRMTPIPEAYRDIEPLPDAFKSGISRRQLAELTGLSREGVRRAVLKLMARGVVIESQRGQLVHAEGLMKAGNARYSVEQMLQPFLAMTEQLLRLGIIHITP